MFFIELALDGHIITCKAASINFFPNYEPVSLSYDNAEVDRFVLRFMLVAQKSVFIDATTLVLWR